MPKQRAAGCQCSPYKPNDDYMDVSENGGTPKSSILIGISITNHPFWGNPIFGNTHMQVSFWLWFAGPRSIQISRQKSV